MHLQLLGSYMCRFILVDLFKPSVRVLVVLMGSGCCSEGAGGSDGFWVL